MTPTLATFAAIGSPGTSSSPNTMIDPFLGPVYLGHVKPDEASTGFEVESAASESQNAANG